MSQNQCVPKLIVFDLDYTLWPFHVDTNYDPPFRINNGSCVIDHRGRKVPYFPEVPKVLEKLSSMNIDLAIASRTGEIDGANQLVDLFGWRKYFKYSEIYPGCKINHFNKFKQYSGYDYCDMLFFDDEQRNIVDITGIGGVCVFVKNGVNIKVLEEGLEKFRKNKPNNR